MNTEAFKVLCIGEPPPDIGLSAWGPFAVEACADLAAAAEAVRQAPQDAVLVMTGKQLTLEALLAWPALSHVLLDSALVAVNTEPMPTPTLKLMQRGAQDVVCTRGLDAATLARRLRLAVERKRLEQATRKAYATDLATGLPNHAQLLEHMTHLLALREREPAPMALIALRIEGLAGTEAKLGAEAANVLRRKVAVRIRSGLRASDVVASLGEDAFAVLLAWIDSAEDAPRVATKLAQSVAQPFTVAGHERELRLSVGLAAYPEHGRDVDALLRRAIGQAASVATVGREGYASRIDRASGPAANDE